MSKLVSFRSTNAGAYLRKDLFQSQHNEWAFHQCMVQMLEIEEVLETTIVLRNEEVVAVKT